MLLFKQLAKDERGAAMMLGVFMFFALMAATGSAIDVGRAMLLRSRLAASLDSAGLAAGTVVSTEDPQTIAEKYFNINFHQTSETIPTTVTATADADNKVITLTATARVPTRIMQLFGYRHIDLQVESEITRANRGMELVMVLDVTGSMQDNNKIGAMKSAAITLVHNLTGSGNDMGENLWIGLVPFSHTVNVGQEYSGWVTSDSFDWGPAEWEGCVDAREADGRDITDDPPSVTQFPRYYWPDDSNNNWRTVNHNGRVTYNVSRYRGPNLYCPQDVTELSSDKPDIISDIGNLTVGGNTHVNLGAAWGWRMLSPRWRGLWGGEMAANDLPLDYDEPLMHKVVILLTDGENTHNNAARTAYWYLSHGRLGTTNSGTARNILDARTRSICTAMKQQGILIYSIAFGDPGSGAEQLMLDCATTPDYFFSSPSNRELQEAFEAIGDSLANLRVSK